MTWNIFEKIKKYVFYKKNKNLVISLAIKIITDRPNTLKVLKVTSAAER